MAAPPRVEATRRDETVAEFAEEIPQHVGHFVVLRKLGEGGMGVVYSAYDEELDRRVAIKLVRRVHSQSSERMRREAQAMAKLSHPNVATVYEVGAHEGQLYLAIEFVKGQTLKAWWHEKERSLAEVLEVMSQAGRGLQAAHDAGLVHRDFKPDNVMIGDDGRVRVLDFGLAGADDENAPVDLAAAESMIERLEGRNPFDTPLTLTGSLMGTPAYMSPEQFLANSAGPKSDQFSFCVTLYELLYGERPFAGDVMTTIAQAVTRGELRPLPKHSRVPGKVRDLVLRGLATESQERHADIRSLLAELDRVTGQKGKSVLYALGGVLLAGALVGGKLGYESHELDQRRKACEAAGAVVNGDWNAKSRGALRAGLLATEVSYAPTVADKVMPWFDDNASAWRLARTAACMNRRVYETWDDERLDKATWCLEDRRLQLSALVSEMSEADAEVVQNAVAAASGLGRVEQCIDSGALLTMPAPPPDKVRGRVMAVRGELARARALESEGKYEAGLEVARAARIAAQEFEWVPLVALALTVEGALLDKSGAYSEAESTNMAAFFDAGRAGDWDTAAVAANKLVFIVGKRQGRHVEAQTWAGLASLAISHASDPLSLRESTRLNNIGAVLHETGEFDEAQRMFAGALKINEGVLGASHPVVADNLIRLGKVHSSLAQYDEARSYFERSLSIRRKNFGGEHPVVAISLESLGRLADFVGDREGARGLLEEAMRIREEALGPDHPSVADSLNALGIWHAKDGNLERAGELFQRGFEILEASLGPDHRDLAQRLNNLGNVRKRLGDFEGARVFFERALDITEKTRGPKHSRVAVSVFNLAQLSQEEGDLKAAIPLYRRALDVFTQALGPDHPRVAFTLTNLGGALREAGEMGEALAALERALVIDSHKDTPREVLAITEFALAKVLWEVPVAQGRDRHRAVELAERAGAGFVEVGASQDGRRENVEVWLTAHRG